MTEALVSIRQKVTALRDMHRPASPARELGDAALAELDALLAENHAPAEPQAPKPPKKRSNRRNHNDRVGFTAKWPRRVTVDPNATASVTIVSDSPENPNSMEIDL